ncbi:hypothetical protein ES703_46155 [subsurface metagenome]
MPSPQRHTPCPHTPADERLDKDVRFSCNVSDTLAWDLGEIQTERFRSEDYLNLEHVKQIARAIEIRTGEKFTGDN